MHTVHNPATKAPKAQGSVIFTPPDFSPDGCVLNPSGRLQEDPREATRDAGREGPFPSVSS